jgi:DNA repair exonuclease SbcCD ATPase subunit
MFVKRIKINNFKSVYGEQVFDFERLTGITNLSGAIGAGKTTICEAIIYGLYGAVDSQTIPSLVSWGEKTMSVTLSLRSKGYDIDIIRNNTKQVEVFINGELLTFSNKKNAQQILESDYYDVPKSVVTKLYLLTFNNFDKSICKMSAGKLREFVDDIFNIGIFTEYKDIFAKERTELRSRINSITASVSALNGERDGIKKQIDCVIETSTGEINALNDKINALNEDLTDINKEILNVSDNINLIKCDQNRSLLNADNGLTALNQTLNNIVSIYKEYNKKYNNLKSGICPTCGTKIPPQELSLITDKLSDLGSQGKGAREAVKAAQDAKEAINTDYIKKLNTEQERLNGYKQQKTVINNNILLTKNELRIKSKQCSRLVLEQRLETVKHKVSGLNAQLAELERKYEDIDKLYNLFYSELRGKFLGNIIPVINSNIDNYLRLLGMAFSSNLNSDFTLNLFNSGNEFVSYNNLSTGQKKTVDVILILSLINTFSQSEFNILFLDELFSNMDRESRDNLLSLIYNMFNSSSVFVVSHDGFDNSLVSAKISISNVDGKSIYNIIS